MPPPALPYLRRLGAVADAVLHAESRGVNLILAQEFAVTAVEAVALGCSSVERGALG